MAGRVEDVSMAVPASHQKPSVRRSPAGRSRARRRTVTRGRGAEARGAIDAGLPAETSGRDAGSRNLVLALPLAEVVNALRVWRTTEARQRAVAPFVILHDRTLHAIAASLPGSVDELGRLPGIGARKLAAYGDAILSVVASAVAAKAGGRA
jgi:ATP-dependent DNA helicase RecQ